MHIGQKGEKMNDLISKKAVELALLEKGQSSKRYKLGDIWELNFDEIREALATVPLAQPEVAKDTNVPTNDCISRQAAIEALIAEVRTVDSRYLDSERIIHESDVIEAISMLSSVTPEPRTGRWLINSDGYYPYCSECKAEPKSGKMTNFCPSCGAKMCGGEQE